MKISFVRTYVSKTKNVPTFVYRVSGTSEELAQYKADQGENYRESDHGEPLYFTVNAAGIEANLIKTSKGSYIPDMTHFQMAASLAKQFGGNFGDQLASEFASGLLGSKASAPTASNNQVAENAEEDTTLGDM